MKIKRNSELLIQQLKTENAYYFDCLFLVVGVGVFFVSDCKTWSGCKKLT